MSEPRLHEFNLLLSNPTAAAKMASQDWPQPQTPALEKWRQRAQAWSQRIERDASRVVLDLSWGWRASGWLSSYDHRGPQVDFQNHPLGSIAAELPALAAAAQSLPDDAIERAAQEVAKHLAVSFERDGVSYLAFPHQSSGLKVRARKGAPEVSAWLSDWRDKARYVLPQSKSFGNPEDRYLRAEPEGEMTEALQALGQAYGQSPFSALNEDSDYLSWGDLPTSGVHAGGRLPGSASSEEPLPSLGGLAAKFTDGEILAATRLSDRPAQAARQRHSGPSDPSTQAQAASVAASRRLGWLAIAMLLGDKPTPATAAAPWAAPACSAELALSLEAGVPLASRSSTEMRSMRNRGGSRPKPGPFPKERSARPAISAMQWAAGMAAIADRMASHYGARISDLSPYQLSVQQLNDLAQAGQQTASVLDATAKRVMDKAFEIASKFERQWLADQGLAQALDDVKLLAPGKPVSTKALNWALANPQAAQAAREGLANPQLGFSARSARYTGALPGDDNDAFIERSRQAWAAKGLGPEGFEGVSKNQACQNFLADLWQAELEERKSKPLKAHRKNLVELGARALQAAFAESAPPEQAIGFARWCEAKPRSFLADPAQAEASPGSQDLFHPDMPVELLSDEARAQNFAAQARARRDAHPAAMRALYRALALGEASSPEARQAGNKSAFANDAAALLALATRGADKAPPMDWSGDLSRMTLSQMALRISASTAKALEEAANSGPHGAFAAKVAAGLGIFEARDGNDLTAQVRDVLRDRHGLGASGWKALAKAPASMVDPLAASFQAQAPQMLQARAQARGLELQAQVASAKASGLSLSLLSWSAQFGLDLQDAADLAKLAQSRHRSSELLGHGTRPILAASAETAQFALNEIQAKAQRMPKIIQSMAERLKRLRAPAKGEGAPPDALEVLRAEVALIDDWLRASEDGVWQTLPPKATFNDLMRRQAVWHEDAAARQTVEASSKAKGWDCPMPRHQQDGWSLEFLGSAQALLEEGREMHHCVSSYSSYCAKGQSRIFSLKLNGERFSTVEMKLKGPSGELKNYDHQHPCATDRWEITQNLGKCNQRIADPSALAFCKSAQTAMNGAHQQWIGDLQAKRSAAAKAGAVKRKSVSGL